MITYPEALAKIKESIKPLQSEVITIDHALGRVNTDAILAPLSLPNFRNSAMDGYAVRTQDLLQATAEQPVALQLQATTYAGCENPKIKNPMNTTIQVMTGAHVHDDYDAVVPIENIRSSHADMIHFHEPTHFGANIREVGEDFIKNEVLINPNSTLTAESIMALSAINLQKINVYRTPQFSIISTGKELLNSKKQTSMGMGIYDSNGPYIQSFLQKNYYSRINPITYISDDPALFTQHIEDLNASTQKTDVIISTGAVSAGEIDFIPTLLCDLGASIIFHKVAIRPGKPILFAVLKSGSYYFGLPGNPMSAAIGMRFFVYPLLNFLRNQTIEQPMMAKLSKDIHLKKELSFFLKAKIFINSQGEPYADILPGQESFKILPLLKANAFVRLDNGLKHYHAGEWVPTYFLM